MFEEKRYISSVFDPCVLRKFNEIDMNDFLFAGTAFEKFNNSIFFVTNFRGFWGKLKLDKRHTAKSRQTQIEAPALLATIFT